jgi:hypothetical protein
MYGDLFPEKGHVARSTVSQGTSAALDNILALTLKAHQRITFSNIIRVLQNRPQNNSIDVNVFD